MQRRHFLQGTALGMGAWAFSRAPLQGAGAKTKRPKAAPILVVIFQRGAMDGLAAVQPLKDHRLQSLRPDLTLSTQGPQGEALIQLNNHFGLHPALAPFAPLYKQKKLAIIHGTGLPVTVRSHFDAQDMMETATPGRKSTPTGWLNRLLAQGLPGSGPFRALALSSDLPRAFHGPQKVLAVEDLRSLAQTGSKQGPAAAFEALYGEEAHQLLSKTGRESIQAAQILAGLDLDGASHGIRYPRGPLADGLKQVARLLHSGQEMSLALIPSTGWDTHNNQRGRFNRTAGNFAQAIDAFWQDLGALQDRVMVLTMTEFGRTVRQNGSQGTDHGRGSVFFALGNRVKGGKVWGQVPKLLDKNLDEGRDLPVTMDFRRVLAGVVRDHLGVAYNASLFPGWEGRPLRFIRRS